MLLVDGSKDVSKVRRIVFNENSHNNLTDVYYYNLGEPGFLDEVSDVPELEGLQHVLKLIEKYNFSDKETIFNQVFDKFGYFKCSYRFTVKEFIEYYQLKRS